MDHALVAERVSLVRERIRRAGGTGVEILAVTKGFGVDAVEAAVAAGLTRIGENYAQEAVPKVAEAATRGVHPEVHFIGHLQSNKVRLLVGTVQVWQTLDRTSVVREVAHRAPGARVFVQVNATGEEAKGGCPPAEVDDLVEMARTAGLAVEGLMTIGPTDEDPARTREAFVTTRRAVDRLGLAQCSMGMSGDLEIAVAEGSTMVRVGTALFGPRTRTA